MSFTVYILYSPSIDQYYIDHTENIEARIFRYNNSGNKSTKKVSDWELVYTEIFHIKSEAYKREMEIKKKKSKRYIEWLIFQKL